MRAIRKTPLGDRLIDIDNEAEKKISEIQEKDSCITQDLVDETRDYVRACGVFLEGEDPEEDDEDIEWEDNEVTEQLTHIKTSSYDDIIECMDGANQIFVDGMNRNFN